MTIPPKQDSPHRVLQSVVRLLRHLAIVALIGAVAYLLAVLSVELADRGGWFRVLGWTAFAVVVAAGMLLLRRVCCLRRVRLAA